MDCCVLARGRIPFSLNFRAFETNNGGVVIDEPPQGSENGPVHHSWNRAFCYKLLAYCKLFELFFFIFIILHQFYVLYNYVDWHKVSCEILVVMQAHRRIKFQLPLYVRCLKLLNVGEKA